VQGDGGEDPMQDLEDDAITATLSAIGCQLTVCDDGWQVRVPPQRAIDLRREVDLIEEVARLVGYDRFAAHLPDPLEPGGLDPAQQVERRLRRGLCDAGLQEICSFSLVSEAEGRCPLANPLLSDYGHLRDGIHGELLEAARRNLQSGSTSFWGFEIGTVFVGSEADSSRTVVAGVICAVRRSEQWRCSGKPERLNYYEARGVLQQPLIALGLVLEDRRLTDHPRLHPGRGADLILEGRSVGWFGQLHPQQGADLDLPDDTHLFELDLAALQRAATRRTTWQPSFRPFATVPASERDLAVLAPTPMPAAELLALIRKAGRPLLEHVELIDRYSSDQLGEGLCSQAFRLRYRDAARTLTDTEVDAAHAKVRSALAQRPELSLRS